ncbi:MAG: hypothetical protein WCJ64_16400 [Rhodospirillaceae bacterium]
MTAAGLAVVGALVLAAVLVDILTSTEFHPLLLYVVVILYVIWKLRERHVPAAVGLVVAGMILAQISNDGYAWQC